MKTIALLCGAGMSTSLLATRMQHAADEAGFEAIVKAYPVADAYKHADDSDIILLGPQVRFQKEKIESQVSCPVLAIPITLYGTMNGAAVFQMVKEALGE